MIDNVETLNRSRECIRIREITAAEVDVRHRIWKREMTAEGPHTRATLGKPPAQIRADEAPAAEDKTRNVAICHEINRIARQDQRRSIVSSWLSQATLLPGSWTAPPSTL